MTTNSKIRALDDEQYLQDSPNSFNQPFLIVSLRHTRFPQSKRATRGGERTPQKTFLAAANITGLFQMRAREILGLRVISILYL